MTVRSDAVVIGAGHNTLITAAYLTRAGLSVTVLEERPEPGGGTATHELTLPGFHDDIASTFHMYAQLNPAVGGGELGLEEHGLRYVTPSPALVSCDGTGTLAVGRDAEATAEAIGRYSPADADAFRRLLADYEPLLAERLRRSAAPPGTVRGNSPAAARLDALAARDGYGVVRESFQDDRTRALLLGFASAIGDLSRPGTGFVPAEFAYLLTRMTGAVPLGGSAALPRALAATVQAHGGRVLCGRRVERIAVENGRATAVTTADGERFQAGRAVVSGAHITQLAGLLGPDVRLPAAFDALRHWRNGGSVFQVHLALRRAPALVSGDGPLRAVTATFGSASGLAAQWADIAAGTLSGDERMMVALAPSLVDPGRTPPGLASVRLFTYAPYRLNGDPARWEAEKERYAERLLAVYARHVEGYAPGDELARSVHTPVDLAALNRHFAEGGYMGGEMSLGQLGTDRPVPGWSAYRMPVPALYQTGSCTHTGGGVSGWPGRNAARAVLEDLGIDPGTLMRDPRDVRLPVLPTVPNGPGDPV
ncbi:MULTISPECIES: phytoene desaturase family protein [Streptomyces]|uniref:phytoene desaturase family protein n=1 Tax=Streptomyces TaxID=1883 RepID=UPI00163D1434|nr:MULTISPECIES: NAD(P)/FAD-dependent oxidoreductase [Streptomyces]MBC2876903.1 NAD(P)/FAD-dependent oxidoreductase [Streptomyces sp. TYQ1024]UBI35930.1 NAD(P)/FAD-dependent oxidoreductase [Streptomyces mobaraensis]UKW28523.1 NAD(P)/FAD-dependent oxidoreductase [Streptomyces sp. TYQ1024]